MDLPNITKYDAIIVLGGGRDNSGNLTPLSTQRLDKGHELFIQGEADKICALGGHFSTYSPNAIYFKQSGAQARKDYLLKLGTPEDAVVLVEDGRDTIAEAFASRSVARERGFNRLLLVTSDKHMERALWIFRRIYGNKFEINGRETPCGDLLNEKEEREYLGLVKSFFSAFPEDIPDPENWGHWYKEHAEFYKESAEIHARYLKGGAETNQAYMGVRKENK